MKTLATYTLVFILILFATGLCGAEDKNTPTDLSEEGWISNGKSLGIPWWRTNPKKMDIIPVPLLYHLELSYSFSDTGGNVDMESHKAKLRLLLRKRTLTSDTIISKKKQETTINLLPNASSTLVEEQRILQEFRLSVLENMALTAGLIWIDNNSAKYIDQRVAGYGGFLFTPIADDKFLLGLEASYGYSDTSYMNDKVPSFYKCDDVEDYDSHGVFLGVKFNWNITDTISLSEDAKYQIHLKDTDYYNWDSTTSLNFRLTENISFSTEYAINFDNNSFVESVQNCLEEQNSTGKMDDTDTTLSFSVKLEF